MEHALVDHVRILRGEHGARRVQAVQPGDGLRSFQRLTRRIFLRCGRRWIELDPAIHEELDAGRAMAGGEARVVGGALVGEGRHRRQRVVHDKVIAVSEDRAQGAGGLQVLFGAVQLVVQVGGGEVHAAVERVGRWADGAGIRGPHRRGRPGAGQDHRRFAVGARQHVGVGAREAQAAQQAEVRASLWRHHRLGEAARGQLAHLGQALQGSLARIRGRTHIIERGDVAERKAGVVVRRADQAIEIEFAGVTHRYVPLPGKARPGDSLAGISSAEVSIEATG